MGIFGWFDKKDVMIVEETVVADTVSNYEFDKAYNEIKQQFDSVTIEGQPNITFSLEGEDIKMNYTVEY